MPANPMCPNCGTAPADADGYACDYCRGFAHRPVVANRQTPEEYAQEVFDTLAANGSDYDSAMREARIALHDCRADDDDAMLQALGARWSA